MKNKFVTRIYFLIIGVQLLFPNLYAQWKETNGPPSVEINTSFDRNVYAMTSNEAYLFAGTRGSGIYRSSDNGDSWIQINNGLPNLDIRALISSDSNIFAGTYGSGIFLSTDNGTTWFEKNNGLPEYKYIISLAKNDNYIFAGTRGSGVFISTDNGTTWFEKNIGLTYDDITYGETTYHYISSIMFSDTSIYVGTQWSFNPYVSGHVFRSDDHGTTWSIASNGVPDNLIMALTNSGTNLFAAINDYYGVYKSTDRGESWNFAGSGLPGRLPRSLKIYRSGDKSYIFVGNLYEPDPKAKSQAVFFSSNEGMSWISFSDGLPNLTVWSFAVKDQYLFAGTDSIVYRRELSEIISVGGKKTGVPNQIHLSQNYPNPFNSTTIILFDLPARSYVTLKIFDLLGKEVSTLLSKELSAGKHSYQWNATGFPSGVYFYQLKIGSYYATKKLLYLK